MEIDIRTVISDEDRADLRDVLGLGAADDLDSAIQKLLFSALAEYRAMLLGGGMPTRGAEALEQRLYFLIVHYYEGRIPTEAEVSRTLHENLSRSRTIIRNVLTRFGRELEVSVQTTLRELLTTVERQRDDGPWRIVIQSDNALERLNQIIADKAPRLDPIRKVPNSAKTYEIQPDSYELLRTELEL